MEMHKAARLMVVDHANSLQIAVHRHRSPVLHPFFSSIFPFIYEKAQFSLDFFDKLRGTSFSKEVPLSHHATRPYPRIAALYFSAQTFCTFSMAFCTSSLVRVRSGARKVREKAMDLLPSPI